VGRKRETGERKKFENYSKGSSIQKARINK